MITDAELAERFKIDVETLHDLRRKNGWPCVRLGRFNIRFTEDQVDQIVRMHSETAALRPASVEIAGQTLRSARAR